MYRSTAVLRAARPAAAAAAVVASGSSLLGSSSPDEQISHNNNNCQASRRPRQHESCSSCHRRPRQHMAACEGVATGAIGVFLNRLSAGGRTSADTTNRQNKDTHGGIPTINRKSLGRPVTLRRQTTLELLHETADVHPIEEMYDVDFAVPPLGRGKFGTVHRGINRQTGEAVAIKKIAKGLTNDVAFQREMENLLFLERHRGHPSIAAIHEHFDPPGDDHFYLVLDLVEGGELFEHLSDHGSYSEADAARVVRQTASALAFLHGIDMVHSDLKPENLMLSSRDGGDATVKIVDFGCAHFKGEDKVPGAANGGGGGTAHGVTPAYCPPEVLKRKRADPRAECDINPSFDVWSLGVIMFVMLTGTHPFDLANDGSAADMERNILSDGPVPIRNGHTDHLSEDALVLMERMMSRDSSQRPTASEILEHPWVRGETASSALISGSDRRLAAFRRHATQIGTTVFKEMLKNADRHGGSQRARRSCVLSMAFRDLDPASRGYVSTKELSATSSFFDADARVTLNELKHLLRDAMVPLHFSKDKIIYDEGSKGDTMYIIQSGAVEVTSTADGFKALRHSGEIIGVEALLRDNGYSYAARCVTPVHVLEISREYYEKYLGADDEVRTAVLETYRKRQRERAKVIFSLEDSVKPLHVKFGETIFREGSAGDLLFMQDSGKINITAAGKKVRTLRESEMTGEHAAFYADKPYNVTAQCVSKDGCTVQILDGKKIREMCDKNKDLYDSFRDIVLRRDFKKALVKATRREFPETAEELRAAFDIIDSNNTGKLEFEYLKRAVLEWDRSYTDDDIRAMMSSLGVKSNNYLTWPEFQRIFGMFNEM